MQPLCPARFTVSVVFVKVCYGLCRGLQTMMAPTAVISFYSWERHKKLLCYCCQHSLHCMCRNRGSKLPNKLRNFAFFLIVSRWEDCGKNENTAGKTVLPHHQLFWHVPNVSNLSARKVTAFGCSTWKALQAGLSCPIRLGKYFQQVMSVTEIKTSQKVITVMFRNIWVA